MNPYASKSTGELAAKLAEQTQELKGEADQARGYTSSTSKLRSIQMESDKIIRQLNNTPNVVLPTASAPIIKGIDDAQAANIAIQLKDIRNSSSLEVFKTLTASSYNRKLYQHSEDANGGPSPGRIGQLVVGGPTQQGIKVTWYYDGKLKLVGHAVEVPNNVIFRFPKRPDIPLYSDLIDQNGTDWFNIACLNKDFLWRGSQDKWANTAGTAEYLAVALVVFGEWSDSLRNVQGSRVDELGKKTYGFNATQNPPMLSRGVKNTAVFDNGVTKRTFKYNKRGEKSFDQFYVSIVLPAAEKLAPGIVKGVRGFGLSDVAVPIDARDSAQPTSITFLSNQTLNYGSGFSHIKGSPYRINPVTNMFGGVHVDMEKLQNSFILDASIPKEEIKLYDNKPLDQKTSEALVILLSRNFNPRRIAEEKKSINESAIKIFAKLVVHSGFKASPQSTKYKLVFPYIERHAVKIGSIKKKEKKKQKKMVKNAVKASGVVVVDDVDSAFAKLNEYIGSFNAGNDSPTLRNLISGLIDFLFEQGALDKLRYKKVLKQYVLA